MMRTGHLKAVGLVEGDPAVAEIEGSERRLAIVDVAGVADRDAVEMPIGGIAPTFSIRRLGRESFAGREFSSSLLRRLSRF